MHAVDVNITVVQHAHAWDPHRDKVPRALLGLPGGGVNGLVDPRLELLLSHAARYLLRPRQWAHPEMGLRGVARGGTTARWLACSAVACH